MDPVSHALLGRTLGIADRGDRFTRSVAVACMLGALAPDLDLVMAAHGWDVYLLAHESWTHTLAASPFVALAVAGAVRLFARDASLATLWRATWLSVVVGHLGFDFVSGSDMRMLQPFSSLRLGPHYFSMADLLLVPIVLAGTALMAVRRRIGVAARTLAVGVLIALAAMCGMKAWSQRAAVAIVGDTLARDGGSSFISRPYAVNGSLTTWWFYQRAGSEVRAWRVNARTGETTLSFARHSADDEPAVAASISAPIVKTLLSLAAVPFARLEHDRKGAMVLWSDLRYCDADSCELSFGARLDSDGQPMSQIVRVGSYERDRGPVR
ncbi:MAG: metal-dependent hydrolase [Acidobacteriota bacterium]